MTLSSTVSEGEAREALARVLASDEFRGSPNLAAFLGFIVERTLEGREDSIKAYTVATEVLGRPESFDPQADPIVRVEATRLRRSLERYYGRCADPIVIDIPRGSYVPHFALRADLPAAGEDAPAQQDAASAANKHASDGYSPRRKGWGLRAALGAGFALLVLGAAGAGVYIYMGTASPIGGVAASGGQGLQTTGSVERVKTPPVATIASLQTETAAASQKARQPQSLLTFGTVLIAPVVEAAPAGRAHAEIVTDLLRNGLARFEDISAVEVASEQASTLPPIAEDTYLLTGRLSRLGPASRVTLRLRHELSQRIVWSGDFMLAVGEGAGLTETEFMRRVGAVVASPSGVIAGDSGAAKRRADPLAVPAACLLEASSWLGSPRSGADDVATNCLSRTIADHPRFAPGWSMLARAEIERYRLGSAPDATSLEDALTHARTAVSLAPQSTRSLQVLSDVLAISGDAAGAQQAIARALDLNPYSLDALQSAGFRKIEAGDYKGGLSLLAEVSAAGAPDNPWRSLLTAIAMSSNTSSVDRFAGLSDPTPHPAALLSTVITKGGQSQVGASRTAYLKLQQAFPGVAQNPEAFLRRAGLGDAAYSFIRDHLRNANQPHSPS
jgi:hypothetical protein